MFLLGASSLVNSPVIQISSITTISPDLPTTLSDSLSNLIEGYGYPSKTMECMYQTPHNSLHDAVRFCNRKGQVCKGIFDEFCNEKVIYTCEETRVMPNPTSFGCTHAKIRKNLRYCIYIFFSNLNQ